MLTYTEAEQILKEIPLIYLHSYMEGKGYIVERKENHAFKFNDDFFKV